MAEPLIWQDLTQLSRRERVAELLLPLPWLLLAWALAAAGASLLALVAVAPFFTTALRLTHDTYHRNLGLSPREGDLLLFVLSLLLGGALHAIEYTHLRHHRDCLGDHDTEGQISRYRFWAALVRSPLYPLRIHQEALRAGSARQRRWVRCELAAVALLQLLIWSGSDAALQTLSLALLAANAVVPMVGIWGVHRGCAPGPSIARSSRQGWLQRISFNMLYHDEHHAWPGIPARHLPRLAQRLDARARTRAPEVLPLRAPTLSRLIVSMPLIAVALAGCTPRNAGLTNIDACALANATITDLFVAPLAVAEPPDGTLAGSCLVRERDARDAPLQLTIHVYTAAAARAQSTSLAQQWRLVVAEARQTHGEGRDLPLRRTRAAVSFGFARGGSGQVLIDGRGLILEVGGRGIDAERAAVAAERLWHALRRG